MNYFFLFNEPKFYTKILFRTSQRKQRVSTKENHTENIGKFFWGGKNVLHFGAKPGVTYSDNWTAEE